MRENKVGEAKRLRWHHLVLTAFDVHVDSAEHSTQLPNGHVCLATHLRFP